MELFFIVLGSYVAGSFPTSYIIARMARGIDIREHGSGNPGATNVFRVVGPAAGAVTFIIDASKGLAPVLIAASLTGHHPVYMIAAGIGAIAGHMWTFFLKFRGGKGVATAAGVFTALLPLPTLFGLMIFAAALLATRYVSLGSMLGALSLPVSAVIRKEPPAFVVFAAIVSLAVVVRHRANIVRLLAGTEQPIIRKEEK